MLIALAIVLTTTPRPVQAGESCSTHGFALHPDRSIEIRAGAGEHFDLVQTVPADEARTLFGIAGVGGSGIDGTWLKIDMAVDSGNENVFSGTGWVPAGALAVKSHPAHAVYLAPSRQAKPMDISLFDAVLPLVGCRGEWVHVELPVTGTEILGPAPTGWMPPGTYCGNPWLECD